MFIYSFLECICLHLGFCNFQIFVQNNLIFNTFNGIQFNKNIDFKFVCNAIQGFYFSTNTLYIS